MKKAVRMMRRTVYIIVFIIIAIFLIFAILRCIDGSKVTQHLDRVEKSFYAQKKS